MMNDTCETHRSSVILSCPSTSPACLNTMLWDTLILISHSLTIYCR